MTTWMWIGIGAMVFGFVMVGSRRTQSWGSVLKRAQHTSELSPIIDAVARYPKADQPNRWDQAITHLWRVYNREAAAHLIREAVRRSDAEILQYWIRQVMEVEPDIAMEVFDEAFLREYFQPDVAARSGRCGSCGCP